MKTVRCRLLILVLSMLFGLSAAQAITCTDTTIPPINPDHIYSAQGDGTVSDTRNGLMWKQCAEGQSGSTCTGSATAYAWSAALTQAANAVFAGYSDWRLPNVNELASLIEDCRTDPAINDALFPATPSANFWSGSPFIYYPNIAWVVNAGYGFIGNDYRNSASRVRLVRGGQFFDSFDLATQQIITFDPAPRVTVGNTAMLIATASSGLPVTISSNTTGICSVSGNTVRGVAVGTCTLAANQAGNASFSPALTVTQSFSIGPAPVSPSAPILISITPGSGSALLNFSPPSNDGGAPISRYTATCTATGQATRTASGSGSPLTVKNLTGGVAYQCALTATNSGELTSIDSIKQPVTPAPGKKISLEPIFMLLLD